MGGFCNVRDRCASYELGRKQEEPSERLCSYGNERPTMMLRGVHVVRLGRDKGQEMSTKVSCGGTPRNTELSGPRPLEAEGSRSNDVLERS